MKKLISALCITAAVVMLLPAVPAKAAGSTFDTAAVAKIIRDFYNADYYQAEYTAKYNNLINQINKGASQKAINKAMTEFATANANLTWVNSQMSDLMTRAINSGNPTLYLSNLKPNDPSLMNEPTNWATFTDKGKYTTAWKQHDYAHSELVNQAAYNGIIGQVGAYAQEQGHIAAYNDYVSSKP